MARSKLASLDQRVQSGVLCLSMLMLVVTLALVILNVATRYLVNVSLAWSSELSRYSLVWSAMLAAAVLVRRGGHLQVDVLERRLGTRTRHLLHIAVAVFSMTFFAALFVSGIRLVIATRGQSASSMDALPMSVVYAIFPISSLIMFAGSALRMRGQSEASDR